MSEMLKKRVRVSFYFDVICDEDSIRRSSDEQETKQYDLALLRSFLVADKEKLLHMLVDAIATKLGLNSTETFMRAFLPQVDTNSHALFWPAIDALHGDVGRYWREACEEDDLPWGSVLDLATEKLFECFNAEFVESQFQIVDGDQE